ncbi:MAG TPA: EAL domain-containing protein [Casimicrobiaceae bacterium]|nr:EAL domain-containing protein [Casimicrobiaceae bacterium]
MDTRTVHVLVIGNDAATAATIRGVLERPDEDAVTVIWVRSLAAGIVRLGDGGVNIVLLDPDLPDSQGIDSFDEILLAAHGVPIVMVTSRDGEDIARLAVHRGAMNRVLKEDLDGLSLRADVRQVLERAALDDVLRVQSARARDTLDSIVDSVIGIDLDGEVTYINRSAAHLTRWSRDLAIGRVLSDVCRIIDRDAREPAPMLPGFAADRDRTASLPANSILVARDGDDIAIEGSIAPIRDQEEKKTGAVIVFHDATDAQIQEPKLSRRAQHDALTDLPNRVLLEDRLNQAISLAKRHGNQVAVLVVDLDRVKRPSDSTGHEIGDALLREVGRRLVATVRRSDTVSRQRGDQFVIVLSEIDHPQNAARHAERIHAALSVPYAPAPRDLRIDASIGISIFPDDGHDAETLIKCADAAMEHARQSGRNMYRLFKPAMYVRLFERQLLEGHLQRALDRGEFVLHYQPTANLETGAITGAEALIRWLHPQRGLLGPAQFVTVAEECGLIAPIGQWVLAEACRQACAWQQAGLRPITVSVNVSALEFRHRRLLPTVRKVLATSRLDPCYLALEVGERVLMQDVEFAARMLRALDSLGVGVAIDDFGRCHSDRSELRRLPSGVLKIDPALVRGGTRNSDDAAIVSAAISLGSRLHQRVVAKGVETREQVTALKIQRCVEAQGFQLGRPMAAEEFAGLLATSALAPPGIERDAHTRHPAMPPTQRAPTAHSMH